MTGIKLKAPATVANFGPGFDAFAVALDEPFDELLIRTNQSNAIDIKVTGRVEGIPGSADENSAGLVAKAFFDRMKITAGLDIEIHRRMKSASGLGTSGASSAACAYGLDKLFRTNLSQNELIEIASAGEIASTGTTHADNVAGCLLGGFILIRNYHPLDIVKMDVPEIPMVICAMKKAAGITRNLIQENYSLKQVKEQVSSAASVIHAISTGRIDEIGRAISHDHISEPARATVIPGYYYIKQKVLAKGVYGFNISGGGSSVFAICDENKMASIAELIDKHFAEHDIEHEMILTKTSNLGVHEF